MDGETPRLLTMTEGAARLLAEEADEEPAPTWHVVYTIVVLVIMFTILIMDKVGTDSVMLTALTAFYLAEIIDIKEALQGFSSQGLLTVMVLFVVAEGLNKTGALNWYVAKLLGRPKTLAGAQLRILVPISILSAFINDTQLVTVCLPIVIQWARKINLSTRYLLIPLSFSALLGGVCTLIGTSTNLVVAGLAQERYADDPTFQNLPLFGLGQYGVPVALIGCAYILLATPSLLARGRYKKNLTASNMGEDVDDLLLGARLTQWSPAAGRTVQRSCLRDTGGIYLVRVWRCETGNVHHAVGPDFVLEVGDVLYFTGLIEGFGDFCAEHGLEMVTNEVEQHPSVVSDEAGKDEDDFYPSSGKQPFIGSMGTTLESVLQAPPEDRMRFIFHFEDAIRGDEIMDTDNDLIVVTARKDLVVVAIDAKDRPGLLLDISKCLARLKLDLHHTEAAVRNGRSLSIWRCESAVQSDNFLAEVWSALSALLSTANGADTVRERGKRVIRAKVLNGRLSGIKISDIDFRQVYKAAIIAVRRGGKSITESLASATLEEGDILVLQTNDDSPLLMSPPADFYTKLEAESKSAGKSGFASKLFGTRQQAVHREGDSLDSIEVGAGSPEGREAVWKDLQVLTADNAEGGLGQREFLTAMTVSSDSKFPGKSANEAGIDKLPEIFLVSLERPVAITSGAKGASAYMTVALSEPLQAGDVLWFSGTASSVGDLRKIPGLQLYQNEEVNKIGEKIFNRRLVQAVVARKGPLVGKTVKEARFRTQYGAAVIAVHREGQRVHEHPGNIKLQSGDVLLLDAGPSFISDKVKTDSSFSLVAEVEDSAPPRLRMLLPALILTVGAYASYVAKLSALIGCAMVAAIIMVALGIMSEAEARKAVKWEIYVTTASAFGIGTALVNSGVAGAVAKFLVKVGNTVGLGDAGLIGAVYLSTVLVSQLVPNNAAAALIFPMAMGAAETTGTDLKLMCYTLMLAASAAFMTPFGYQINLMVMAIPSTGYTTLDYIIFGTPMQIVLLIATTIFLVSPAWICWLGSFAIFMAVSFVRVGSDLAASRHQKTS